MGECIGASKVVTNPSNAFYVECSNDWSCQNGNFHIELNREGRTRPTTFFEGFVLSGMNAAKSAVFRIDNGYNVEIQNIICAPNACNGCLVKITESLTFP